MDGVQRVPYSRRALENLAVALRVNSAAIWFDPTTSRVDLKEINKEEDLSELMESEE